MERVPYLYKLNNLSFLYKFNYNLFDIFVNTLCKYILFLYIFTNFLISLLYTLIFHRTHRKSRHRIRTSFACCSTAPNPSSSCSQDHTVVFPFRSSTPRSTLLHSYSFPLIRSTSSLTDSFAKSSTGWTIAVILGSASSVINVPS